MKPDDKLHEEMDAMRTPIGIKRMPLLFVERDGIRERVPMMISGNRISVPFDCLKPGDVLAFEFLHDGREPNEWLEVELGR